MKKPKKKPRYDRFFTPRCPVCCHSDFKVMPALPVVVSVQYHDNGDVVWKLERQVSDDEDVVQCRNCEKTTTWPECDYRRK